MAMGGGFLRFLFAVVLILAGAGLVLANIGVMDMNMDNAWLYIYPSIFVLFGLKWMIDKIRQKGGSWIFGSFFFIFGSLLLLDRFDVIAFQFWDVYKLWPLLIIYIGFSFIRKPSRIKVTYTSDGNSKGETEYDNSYFSVGEHDYSQPNWKVEPMNLKSMAGDFYMDFSKAFIPDKETPITIKSLAGDVNILIPENIAFRVDASAKAGDIDVAGQKAEGINRRVRYETDDYATAVKKLDLMINMKAGSIRIVTV
ncbi:cell wall-active antibiotics response protein LiaF [Virgibacillus siamensis]|uniref:cell wall-active antibiotics response protein LiaF n=1 Tax=Virgibacillus siamensis TaxID=480071 RepID=UPI001FECF269|nr:cell wall-active antibiotics response protein LiaF [Virgibacillus siamensis]